MARKRQQQTDTARRPARRGAGSVGRAVRTPNYQPPIIRWRYFVVCFLLLCLTVLLVWKMASIQVLPQQVRGFEFLQQYGQSQFVHEEVINANRGVITDRNGEPLAVSSKMVSLCGNPQVLMENQSQWPTLADALGMSRRALANKINAYATKEFMYLRRHLPPTKAEAVLRKELPGVFGRDEYQRFYPAGEVAAHIVGVTNIDNMGQEGLELGYQDWLRGVPGIKKVAKDLKGRTIEDLRLVRAARPGKDMQLSIDLRLQYLAHRELKATVARHNAVSGSLVILDSRTGELLAMANQPSYNPNNRQNLSPRLMKNRAVTDQFEPGSTMKPFTVLAALESKKFKPHTPVDTSPGRVHLPGKTVFDPVNYGMLDVSSVIAESSQVGITKIAMEVRAQQVRNMFYRVGLGHTTGSGFPGEAAGSLPNHNKWHPVERATLAYGYGLTITTLQLAQAYNVFASGGALKPVSVLKRQRGEAKNTGEQVVDRRYADQVLAMLGGVLEPGGTGVRARLDSYTAGGKTGTAHKASEGGYLDEAKFSVFAGIAPLEKPRIVMAIMINEPRKGLYGGGEVAAPVFSRVAEGALRILQTPPDKLSAKKYTHYDDDREPLS